MKNTDAYLEALKKAFEARDRARTDTLRVFHGPGEGIGRLRDVAVERFDDHYWVTQWQLHADEKPLTEESFRREVWEPFFKEAGARCAVLVFRPLRGTASPPTVIFGSFLPGKIVAKEGRRKFWIDPGQTLHPGLFLDHAPLRDWLEKNMGGKSVLNTFAYTGSLSVAAGLGGASHVTTLDLSKVTTEWARENWKLNSLDETKADFVYGDVFEWLPKWRRKDRKFDCVILDPPSFSRGKSGTFSTAKDLVELHKQAVSLLNPEGFLITSINSANIHREKFEADVFFAIEALKRKAKIVKTIQLPPETFPVKAGSEKDHYLKGLILSLETSNS